MDVNINDDSQQKLNELTRVIPHIETPIDSIKEYLHRISGTKLCHYYLSYVWNAKIANKLTTIRQRFLNGTHAMDITNNLQFVTVYGGNNMAQFNSLIQKATNAEIRQSSNDIEITFTDLDALNAAIVEYHNSNGSEQITILDLASRRHVGGLGFYPYSGTQEEDLIRCSNLYWLLHPKYNTYLAKQLKERHIDDAHIPYFGTVCIENVIFMSNNHGDSDKEKRRNTEICRRFDISKRDEYKFNVIASAAPDLRHHSNEYKAYFRKASTDQIKAVLCKKIEAIMATCIVSKNTSVLIAGAFGCGAYKCDTHLVAECFRQVIDSHKYKSKGIKKIVFAIAYDDKKLNVFRDILNVK